MKQLSSFLVVNVNGSDRLSYTYDEIDSTTGDPISTNNKANCYIVDSDVANAVEVIRSYIRNSKLS